MVHVVPEFAYEEYYLGASGRVLCGRGIQRCGCPKTTTTPLHIMGIADESMIITPAESHSPVQVTVSQDKSNTHHHTDVTN